MTLVPLLETLATERAAFTRDLKTWLPAGLNVLAYQRYLSMQYHLTKGVQWYFMSVAAHDDLCRMRKLRDFLFNFANEEELHYTVAEGDLHALNQPLLPIPFDVELWHAYFRPIVQTRPFVRLGAAALLENLSNRDNVAYLKELLSAGFLNRENTKFVVLHMHETLPHGQQILDALAAENLSPQHVQDLVEGAVKASVLYRRMVRWCMLADDLPE